MRNPAVMGASSLPVLTKAVRAISANGGRPRGTEGAFAGEWTTFPLLFT
jgi:hypothetical protein